MDLQFLVPILVLALSFHMVPADAAVLTDAELPVDVEVLSYIQVHVTFLVPVYVLVPESYQVLRFHQVIVLFLVMEYVMELVIHRAAEDSSLEEEVASLTAVVAVR